MNIIMKQFFIAIGAMSLFFGILFVIVGGGYGLCWTINWMAKCNVNRYVQMLISITIMIVYFAAILTMFANVDTSDVPD